MCMCLCVRVCDALGMPVVVQLRTGHPRRLAHMQGGVISVDAKIANRSERTT